MSTLHAMSKLFSAAMISPACVSVARAGGYFPCGRLLDVERNDRRPLGRREREEGITEGGVEDHPIERHGHRVLELVVEHGLADHVVLGIEGEDEAGKKRRGLLGDEVEDGAARAVRLVGGIQEAHSEFLAHLAQALEKA